MFITDIYILLWLYVYIITLPILTQSIGKMKTYEMTQIDLRAPNIFCLQSFKSLAIITPEEPGMLDNLLF